MENTENQENSTRGKVYFMSYDNLYLPSIAKNCGYEFKINDNKSLPQLLDDILEYSPDYLVAEICFQNYKPKMETLARIKQLSNHTKIIVTGKPFLTYNNNVTYENPFISYVIMGEAEYTLKDILDGIPDNEILGICYTDENMQATKNKLRPFIENLDELPFPIRNYKKNSIEFIEVSRGCPHHCFFCLATSLRGNKTRYRSVESVIQEIKECYQNKITTFIFKADNFNTDKEWVTELCNKIIENKLKIAWATNIIPKNIDNNLVKLMKKSGCILCKIGIESGAINILNSIEKNILLDDIKNTIKIFKKNKIETNNCFILGLPWETEETAEETIKFAIELDSNNVTFNIAAPYPGTKFFVYSMINKLVSGDINFSNAPNEPIVRCHKLPKERLAEIRKQAYKRYYIRPKYILRNILTFKLKNLAKILTGKI